MQKTARYKWVLVVTELFNMAVNDFDAKQSTCYGRVLVVTELVLSGTQCTCSLSIVFNLCVCPRWKFERLKCSTCLGGCGLALRKGSTRTSDESRQNVLTNLL